MYIKSKKNLMSIFWLITASSNKKKCLKALINVCLTYLVLFAMPFIPIRISLYQNLSENP